MAAATISIDARGMRCPWPALRLSRALRDAMGAEIELLADDPAAERECSAAAVAASYRLKVCSPGVFRLSPAASVNTLFTHSA